MLENFLQLVAFCWYNSILQLWSLTKEAEMTGEGQMEQIHTEPLVCPHCGVVFPQTWPDGRRGFMAHVFEYLATGDCYFSSRQ